MDEITNQQITEVISVLNKAFSQYGIDFYLIGARARDYWFDANKIPIYRGTFDIDFAILVPDMDHFEDFKKSLSRDFNFKLLNISHRVVYIPYDIVVDLIPYGAIENAGYINFNDKFDTKFSVIGFQEVFENSEIKDIADINIKIASLPGICILKLIAWSDNPNNREKDIEDINSIIQNYFDIESVAIYNDHHDLFVDGFDRVIAGARVLGRQMRAIIGGNDKLNKRIISILEENTINPKNSRIGDLLVRGSDRSVEDAILPFKELLKGIQDK